jgi:hypothetical protein
MYMSTNEALEEVMKNERARNQTMEIINQIRAMGGVPVILRLAGAILSVPPAKTETV